MDTPKRSRLINALGARLNKYNSPGQQNDLRHSTATSEEQLNSSLLKSPSRTPVTENDPLGALANEDEENVIILEYSYSFNFNKTSRNTSSHLFFRMSHNLKSKRKKMFLSQLQK